MYAENERHQLLSDAIPKRPPLSLAQRQAKFGASRSRSTDKCAQSQASVSHQPPPLSTSSLTSAASAKLRHSHTFDGSEQQFGQSSSSAGERLSSRQLSFDYGLHNATATTTTTASTTSAAITSEKVFLEHQLRSYSEQLKSITESVRRYSEQAKLLSDMRNQRAEKQHAVGGAGGGVGMSTNAVRKTRPPNSLPIDRIALPAMQPDVITPSHQLRVFLDSIRSTMQETTPASRPGSIDETPEVDTPDDDAADEDERLLLAQAASHPTPSDQLHSFLDEIRRSNVVVASDPNGGQRPFGHERQPQQQQQQHQQRVATDLNTHKLNNILQACHHRRRSTKQQPTTATKMYANSDAVMYLRSCTEAIVPTKGVSQQQQRCMELMWWREDLQHMLLLPDYDRVLVMANRIYLFSEVLEMQEQQPHSEVDDGTAEAGNRGAV